MTDDQAAALIEALARVERHLETLAGRSATCERCGREAETAGWWLPIGPEPWTKIYWLPTREAATEMVVNSNSSTPLVPRAACAACVRRAVLRRLIHGGEEVNASLMLRFAPELTP